MVPQVMSPRTESTELAKPVFVFEYGQRYRVEPDADGQMVVRALTGQVLAVADRDGIWRTVDWREDRRAMLEAEYPRNRHERRATAKGKGRGR